MSFPLMALQALEPWAEYHSSVRASESHAWGQTLCFARQVVVAILLPLGEGNFGFFRKALGASAGAEPGLMGGLPLASSVAVVLLPVPHSPKVGGIDPDQVTLPSPSTRQP